MAHEIIISVSVDDLRSSEFILKVIEEHMEKFPLESTFTAVNVKEVN